MDKVISPPDEEQNLASILIAEDEALIALHLRHMLLRNGYTIAGTVASGEEAIKQAQLLKPDLVLMDIRLAGNMSGIRAAEQIFSHFDIPIIYLSAHMEEDLIHQSMAAQPYGFLAKPVQDQELHLTIEIALHKHYQDRQFKKEYRRYKDIVENFSLPITIVSPEGAIEYVNQSQSGFLPPDSNHRSLFDYVPSEFHPTVRKAMEEAGKYHSPQDFEIQINNEQGQTRYVNHITPLKTNDDISSLIISSVSVSESKIQQFSKSVEEESIFELFKNTPVLIAITVLEDGRLVEVNETFLKACGGTREEVIGKTITELGFSTTTDRQSALNKTLTECHLSDNEIVRITKDEKLVYLLYTSELVSYKNQRCILSIGLDISKLKELEDSIRENEEKYHQLFAVASDAIFMINNKTGQILEANASASELYGYTNAELLKMRNIDLSAQPEETRNITVGGGTRVPIRWHRKKDGTIFPVEISGQHFEWRGQAVHITAVRDITQRIQKEEALRDSEGRFESAFQNAVAGKVMVSPKGLVLQANESFCRMIGYSERELLSRHINDITYPDDRSIENDLVKQILSGEREYAWHEKRYVRKDGKVIWGFLSLTLIRDKKGQPQHFVGEIQDINERKIAEEALRENEARLQNIIDCAGAGYFLIDKNGIYQKINEAWLHMHGFSNYDEIIGHHFSSTQVGNDMEKAKSFVDYVISGKAILIGEFSRRCKDGSIGYHTFSANPVYKGGQIVGLEGFIMDITERKQIEEALKKSLTEKEILLREVHHRVKNNLQVIISLIKMQSGEIKDSQVLGKLTDLEGRARAMALVHESLYKTPDLANVNFNDYLQMLSTQLLASYGARKTINVQISAEDVPLDISIAVPCGLIANELISNALKYAFPQDKPNSACEDSECTIWVELKGNKHELTLTIHDNGVGLPANFDWRDSPTMGLQIVNLLADQIGGRFEVSDKNGTSFTLTVPRVHYSMNESADRWDDYSL